MATGRKSPFLSGLSRDDYSALENVSRGIGLAPHTYQHLIGLGLITKALGQYVPTPKGAFLLASGPTN